MTKQRRAWSRKVRRERNDDLLFTDTKRERDREEEEEEENRTETARTNGTKPRGTVRHENKSYSETQYFTDERIDGLITFWPGKNAIFTIRVVSHPHLDLAPSVVKPKATREGTN